MKTIGKVKVVSGERKRRGGKERDKAKEKAIEEGVQALLRNELVREYREYKAKGELSILDKDNIEAMFKQYKNLGGNGTVKHLVEEILELPTKIIQE